MGEDNEEVVDGKIRFAIILTATRQERRKRKRGYFSV